MAPKGKKKVKKSKKKEPKGEEEKKPEDDAPEYKDPKLGLPEVTIAISLATPPTEHLGMKEVINL